MDLHLHDLTVLITGASGGIGRALARAFAAEGASLVLTGHARTDELRRWVDAQPWAASAVCATADVRDPDALERAVRQGEDRFGRVDIAVANAGVWPRAHELLHELPPERLAETLAVNLAGAAHTARAFLAGIARQGPREDGRGAALCFIGSTAGRFGEQGHADYAMAKAGLVGLTLSLKNEIVHLDPKGRVVLVEPGWTVTEMAREELDVPGNVARPLRTMPLRQLARASDIADAVVYLCSPRARHVSGSALTVAGGMEGRVLWGEAQIDEGAVRADARGQARSGRP